MYFYVIMQSFGSYLSCSMTKQCTSKGTIPLSVLLLLEHESDHKSGTKAITEGPESALSKVCPCKTNPKDYEELEKSKEEIIRHFESKFTNLTYALKNLDIIPFESDPVEDTIHKDSLTTQYKTIATLADTLSHMFNIVTKLLGYEPPKIDNDQLERSRAFKMLLDDYIGQLRVVIDKFGACTCAQLHMLEINNYLKRFILQSAELQMIIKTMCEHCKKDLDDALKKNTFARIERRKPSRLLIDDLNNDIIWIYNMLEAYYEKKGLKWINKDMTVRKKVINESKKTASSVTPFDNYDEKNNEEYNKRP